MLRYIFYFDPAKFLYGVIFTFGNIETWLLINIEQGDIHILSNYQTIMILKPRMKINSPKLIKQRVDTLRSEI